MWIAYILVGASIYVLAYQFFKAGQGKGASKLTTSAVVSQSLILRLSMPILRTYLLPSVQNLPLENFRKDKKKKIQSAGMSEELTPDEFFCFKLFLAITLPLMAVIYNFALNLINPLILISIFGSIGYFFPELWLGSLIRDRQVKIRNAIPFVIDLLSLCTEAGLDFMGAIQRVVEKAKQSPLIDELNLVLQELKLGTTRADSLRNMATRINMPEISSIVAVLVTADQMGASISQVLKAQSDQIRGERFIRAEK